MLKLHHVRRSGRELAYSSSRFGIFLTASVNLIYIKDIIILAIDIILGAIDGKHIVLQAPKNAGSEFYNFL